MSPPRIRPTERAEHAQRLALDRMLAHAERAIALLERARPLNARSEHMRLLASWQAGDRAPPELLFAPPPDFSELRSALELVAERLSGFAGSRLYAERAAELALEACAAQAIGGPEFCMRAGVRYPIDEGPHGRLAFDWARSWADSAPPEQDREIRHVSDDERDPMSLISAMQRAVGEQRLPFRVRLSQDLPCAAATGERLILVRPQVAHTESAVRRIVLHEIEGHALLRTRAAREELGLFGVGSAGGADDEEGRALWLEQRAGWLDASRRTELGRRHLAALSVRAGANWVDTVELLSELGSDLKSAFELATRVHRGGGLAREIVYLPALARVGAALAEDPELSGWLERGRLSVAAARELRALGEPPELAA